LIDQHLRRNTGSGWRWGAEYQSGRPCLKASTVRTHGLYFMLIMMVPMTKPSQRGPTNQVFTKKGQWLFFTNYLAACTDCQGCNTSICTPSRNRLLSSVHFDQFNAQNLRNVN
jgi:hypothetical protein